MTGLKILAALLGAAVLVVAYVLWPSEADIGRRLEPIDQHRAECEATLGECSELIQFLDDHKPTSVKKRELEELRSRFDELERQTRELEKNDSLERADRRRGLDAMEESFYALLRDAQDLRARLREMQSYFLALQPVVARTEGSLPGRGAAPSPRLASVRTEAAKYVLVRDPKTRAVLREELYDLVADPAEKRPLSAESPENLLHYGAAFAEAVAALKSEVAFPPAILHQGASH